MRAFLPTGLPALLLLAVFAPSAHAEADAQGSPPQNVDISNIGSGILVTWDAPATGSVESYLIQRLTSYGQAPPIFLDPGTTQFVDAIDVVGTFAAAYRVTAFFTDGTQASSAAGAAFLQWLPTGPFCNVVIGTETSLDGYCWIDFFVDTLPPDCPHREDIRLTLYDAWELVSAQVTFIDGLVPQQPITGVNT